MQAMAHVRRILQLDPWREEAHRQLMWLLARSGQRSAALAQYELCRQALLSELNVEPDAATLDLVARIRAGDVDKSIASYEQAHHISKRGEPDEKITCIGRKPYRLTRGKNSLFDCWPGTSGVPT